MWTITFVYVDGGISTMSGIQNPKKIMKGRGRKFWAEIKSVSITRTKGV